MAIVKCAHCPTDINTMDDKYYQSVPEVGDLCMPCWRTWTDKKLTAEGRLNKIVVRSPHGIRRPPGVPDSTS